MYSYIEDLELFIVIRKFYELAYGNAIKCYFKCFCNFFMIQT